MTKELDIEARSPIEKRNAQAKTRDQLRDEEFKGLMEQRAFRRFLWDFMGEGQAFMPNMATSDMLLFGVNEGKRRMALSLLERVNRLCPEKYGIMAAEANNVKDETNG